MHAGFHGNPALVVAIAMAAGVVAQSVARHLRIPGIVLLLGAGVLLGPDVLNVVTPNSLGHALEVLIGFAVAVILFDGGLNLNLKRMRRQAPVIQRLLTIGVVVTTVGGALAAHLFLGWGLRAALLFGTLVIVTGPTVVTPLLRRIRVRRSIETILETEGVLIDALGAVIAVVALEIALGTSLASGALSAPMRLVAGLAIGGAGGALMVVMLYKRHVVPSGYETIFTLSFTLFIYQVSNALTPESGIMAAIMAGTVVGNWANQAQKEIREFKEQLTTLLIGMLFVLLAADVRIGEVKALGWQGVLVVAALMFVVRPVSILLCTWGTSLNWREKAFLSWVAPRGIVAAAVASLFADRLDAVGDQVGGQLRALVFLVIAATVVLQGATAGLAAGLLKVRRPGASGVAILGANPLARLLARALQDSGMAVVVIDSDAAHCAAAEEDELKVIFGNAMDEKIMLRSHLDTRQAVLGLTYNSAANLLFADKARSEAKVPYVFAAVETGRGGVTASHVAESGAHLLFGQPCDLEVWGVRIDRGQADLELWELAAEAPDAEAPDTEVAATEIPRTRLLPVFTVRKESDLDFVDADTRFAAGRRFWWLVMSDQQDTGRDWLRRQGWTPVAAEPEVSAPA